MADNNRLIDYGHEQVLARGVEEKAGDLSGRKDFLSRIIDNHDKKTVWQPSQADLDTESLNMMNAGADPYSSVLAGVFFYLVHNPEVLQKAISEVRCVPRSSYIVLTLTAMQINICYCRRNC